MTRTGRRSSRTLLAVAVLLGALASYLTGAIGYGFSAEYGGGSVWGGGFWQVLLIGALVVGPIWAGLTLLTARLTRRPLPGLPLVIVGVVACFGAGLVGSVLGSAVHADSRQAARASCADGVREEMAEFAALARFESSPYRARPRGTPEGCMVDIAVPNRLGDDYAYVTGQVADAGFRPDAGDSWVREALRIRMRSEEPEGGREHLVRFTGTRG